MSDLGTGTRALVRALLPGTEPGSSERARVAQLVEGVPQPSAGESWLLLSVLTRRLPLASEVQAFRRRAASEGVAVVIAASIRSRRSPLRWRDLPVHIVTGEVLLDVHDSAFTRLVTGVQRVSRSLADSWMPRGAVLIGWNASRTQLLPIRPTAWTERSRRSPFERRAIVPWGGWFTLPEVVTDVGRTTRIAALAEFSGARTMLIGDDAIPLTTAETTGPKMPGVFSKYLVAASRMDVVACISEAAATEYAGWKSMLASAGLRGPEIRTVMLAETAPAADAAWESRAREKFLSTDADGELPLVLCVGSHEPRKNHEAVLHAAELLWREGHRFSLVFIGGNAWNSEAFRTRLAELRDGGRAVVALRGIDDALLWWAYRLAAFTVFPSINEGFGLPVAESLQSGTPAIASRFGSLAEIAAGGGCVLVDPHDDHSIAAGMRSLLTDDARLAALTAEASARPAREWSDYADHVWNVLME
jgi:glycosyltransferase involved in cell wall biosynthesis